MTATGADMAHLAQQCRTVLLETDARRKAALSQMAAEAVQSFEDLGGFLTALQDLDLPDRPGRPARPVLLRPAQMPKRGAGGGPAGRTALLHALAHIELNAIDLAWDAALRFGADMPQDFVRDWVSVAHDEARHFLMLADRLDALGRSYGALPAHDGLWQAAQKTHHDLAGRMAIVPLVLEARALDVSPPTIAKMRHAGDAASADILNIIFHDEIGHVAIGMRWFEHVCARQSIEPNHAFDAALDRYFSGKPKPPFNYDARRTANLPDGLYDPSRRNCQREH